jgi:hypothetical protein
MMSEDLTGLPLDLAVVLRDPGVVIPQDAAVFDLIAAWAKAPTPTAGVTVTVSADATLIEQLARQTRATSPTTGVGCG